MLSFELARKGVRSQFLPEKKRSEFCDPDRPAQFLLLTDGTAAYRRHCCLQTALPSVARLAMT